MGVRAPAQEYGSIFPCYPDRYSFPSIQQAALFLYQVASGFLR